MDEDLKDLIANPRENETIELKAWLDLDERSHQAKVARHLAALANHGGGYLVFGFNNDLTPDKENRPQSLDKYTRDRFTGIIERYLTPVFQCAVSHIEDSSGNQFPVIRVPSHGSVPIAAKADGPQIGRTPKGIRIGRYYIRKPGPKSEPVIGTEEWRPLIRRCVLNERDQLLRDFRVLLQTPITPSLPAHDRLARWHAQGETRFIKRLSEARGFHWPVFILGNRCQLSYLISSLGDTHHLTANSFTQVLEDVNRELRDIIWTGWSMFYPFKDTRTAFYPELADGTGGDVLETSLLVADEDFDHSLPDMWRVAPDGRATILRPYREDRKASTMDLDRPAGTWISPLTIVRETAEVVAHANSFAKRIQGAAKVSFRCTWRGLKGREINDFNPAVCWNSGRIASADTRTSEGEWYVGHLRSDRSTIVSQLSCPILRLFGFTNCDAAFVARMEERFMTL